MTWLGWYTIQPAQVVHISAVDNNPVYIPRVQHGIQLRYISRIRLDVVVRLAVNSVRRRLIND